MKRLAIVTAAFAAAAIAAAPAVAQDLSGDWELTAQGGRGGQQTIQLSLTQDGAELTGTVTLSFGRRGGRGGPREIEITNGTVEGNEFSFTVELSFGDNTFTQTYSGTVDGDTMEGTIEGGRGGGRPFTGKRAT